MGWEEETEVGDEDSRAGNPEPEHAVAFRHNLVNRAEIVCERRKGKFVFFGVFRVVLS